MSSNMPKLTDSSRSVAQFRKMFQDEKIGAEDTPNAIWDRDFIFKRHELDDCHDKYNKNKLKRKEGSNGKFN